MTFNPQLSIPWSPNVLAISCVLAGCARMASRIQVLAVFEPVNVHLSVAEIHQRVQACLPASTQPPDLATIYRTVTTLVEQSVLHALTLDNGTITYGLATAPHHHAVCTEVDLIIEVPARQLSSALEHAMAAARSRCRIGQA